MTHSLDDLFARAGLPLAANPSAHCPTDEAFADYLGALLPAAEREALELHSLACADCHDLLRMIVDVAATGAQVFGAATAPAAASPGRLATRPSSPVRIVGRLVQRGIELINHAELVFDMLTSPGTPALGIARGTAEAPAAPATAPLASPWISVRGPGEGLDALELQMQTNGTARLVVRCEHMPALRPGELATIALDIDGSVREKRPFGGDPVTFAPIGRGAYRVRLVARAPGGTARPLAEASLELTD